MQPRERYALLGPENFGEIDLIVLILGTGAGGRSSRSIATAILEHFGSLADVLEAPVQSLAEIRGVGPARAVRLHAALALGRRSVVRPLPATVPVRGAAEASVWFLPALSGLAHEEFHALYLDRKGRPLCYRRLTSGSDAATVVDSRQILRPAVAAGASALLVAHNHPSGDPEPSTEDRVATRRLRSACDAVGIKILDHLIFGHNGYISMAERGEF